MAFVFVFFCFEENPVEKEDSTGRVCGQCFNRNEGGTLAGGGKGVSL